MFYYENYCVPNYDVSLFEIKPSEEKNNENQNPIFSIKQIKKEINKEENINFGAKENQENSNLEIENKIKNSNKDNILKLIRRKYITSTKLSDENKNKPEKENVNANKNKKNSSSDANNINNLEIVSMKSFTLKTKLPEKLLLEEKISEVEKKEIGKETRKEFSKEIIKEIEKEKNSNNYFISLPNKDENFSSEFIDELNFARYDLKAFSKKYDELLQKVYIKNRQFYVTLYDNSDFPLKNGASAITESSNYFKNNLNKKLEKIELIDELKVPFQDDYIKDSNEIRKFFMKTFEEISLKTKGRYEILNFYSLRCNHIPKNALILMFIIEVKKDKEIRDLFFSKEAKFMGINFKKLEGNFCKLNIIFANKA